MHCLTTALRILAPKGCYRDEMEITLCLGHDFADRPCSIVLTSVVLFKACRRPPLMLNLASLGVQNWPRLYLGKSQKCKRQGFGRLVKSFATKMMVMTI